MSTGGASVDPIGSVTVRFSREVRGTDETAFGDACVSLFRTKHARARGTRFPRVVTGHVDRSVACCLITFPIR